MLWIINHTLQLTGPERKGRAERTDRRRTSLLRLACAALHVQGIGLDRDWEALHKVWVQFLELCAHIGVTGACSAAYSRMSFASSALRRLGQEGPRLARRVHVGRPALGGYVSQDVLALRQVTLKLGLCVDPCAVSRQYCLPLLAEGLQHEQLMSYC